MRLRFLFYDSFRYIGDKCTGPRMRIKWQRSMVVDIDFYEKRRIYYKKIEKPNNAPSIVDDFPIAPHYRHLLAYLRAYLQHPYSAVNLLEFAWRTFRKPRGNGSVVRVFVMRYFKKGIKFRIKGCSLVTY